MTEDECLERMIPPSKRRPGAYRQGIVQIWITRACDKACFGCTQGSNLGGNPGMITPELYEQAVLSLKDYFGVVGMFGGNPAVHPKFDLLCEILREHIPFERRGLWCNNPLGKGATMRRTFDPAVSNLNVHLDQAAYDEFKRDWPECNPVGLTTDSRHSPPYVAMRDLISDESWRWSLISRCDINQNWSAMIGVFRGELRAWFCEIAGAQSILHQYDPAYPDTGLPVADGWWQEPMTSYREQVRTHCHTCGIPLRGRGELAASSFGEEQVTASHAAIYRPKVKDRPVSLVTELHQLRGKVGTVTHYLENAK